MREKALLVEAIKKLETLNLENQQLRSALSEPIAIVSMACRLPGAINNPETYWKLLEEGRDAVEPFPERWDVESLYDPEPEAKGKTYCKEGGFLKDTDKFDANFFAISPREAQSMDPQQRIILETTWEALERAAIKPFNLSTSKTGVYIGSMGSDYAQLQDLEQLDGYASTGSLTCITSGRVAYTLGLQGPAITVDTACSSSLVAIHLACQALRLGECDLALAGGVQVMNTPVGFIEFSQLKGLAKDGRCKSFSSLADGVGWSEGCGIVVLKRLSDAQKDHNKILAVIRATAVNQDGRSQGLTAPNGLSQQKVIEKAIELSGLKPSDIDAIEAHGTGTTLGDPIEANSLIEVFSQTRPQNKPLYLGSSKSNFGHAQAAAGVAGVIKMVLALQNEKLPKSLYAENPSSYIKWEGSGLELLSQAKEWKRSTRVRRCGISSFGISGTNSHLILEEAPENNVVETTLEQHQQPLANLLLLSAQSEQALKAQALNYATHIENHPEQELNDICHSAAIYRTHFSHRLVLPVSQRQILVSQLREFSTSAYLSATSSLVVGLRMPKIAYLFTGQGSQYVGMGKKLYESVEVFRQNLDSCIKIANPFLDYDLLEIIFAEEGTEKAQLLNHTKYTQVSLFALEYSLYQMWKAFGLVPSVLLGHSIGELVAGVCAGVFSLEDGVRLAVERGRLIGSVERGSMLSLELPEEKTLELIKPYGELSIAGINSPNQTVVSGQTTDIEALIQHLEKQSIKYKKLKVSHAFHSKMMDSILDEFERVFLKIKLNEPNIAIVSNLTGNIEKECFTEPSYWVKQLRQSVRFADCVTSLVDFGITTFIELGPQPILSTLANQCLDKLSTEQNFNYVPSLKPKESNLQTLTNSLSSLWLNGIEINWSRLLLGKFVEIPTYPFQRERYWIDRNFENTKSKGGEELLYSIGWEEIKIPISSKANEEDCLVFSDNTKINQELIENLSNNKKRIVLVKTGNRFEQESENTFYINPSLIEDYLLLFQTLESKNLNISNILYLWPLNLAAEVQPSDIFKAAILPLLNLIGSLSSKANLPKLSIVTSRAQSLSIDNPLSPLQAIFWGLGKVIAWEHPKLFSRLVDIEITDLNIGLLKEICQSNDLEPEITIRKNSVYRARLQHYICKNKKDPMPVQDNATYLITGATGTLGLALAKELVRQGAQHLVLISRKGLVNNDQQLAIDELKQIAVNIWTPKLDISNKEELEHLFTQINKELPPLKGIVHAAGVVEQSPLVELTENIWDKHIGAKVNGALNLHTLTLEMQLDFFILYSSASAWLGLRQAGAYCAANAFLDALAKERRSLGLSALSIAWGVWQGGMADLNSISQSLSNNFGIGSLSIEKGISILNQKGLDENPSIAVLPYQWDLYKNILVTSQQKFLSKIIGTENKPETAKNLQEPNQSRLLALEQASLSERKSTIIQLVKNEVAAVLGSSSSSVDVKRGFAEQGMDSVMALELRLRLEKALAIALPSTIAFEYPTIEGLSSYLLNQIFNVENQTPLVETITENKLEPIAIIGASCRFPGGVKDLESFWRLLIEGKDAVDEIPLDRWKLEDFYDPDPQKQGMSYSKWGGFLDDVKGFDAAFFHISPREAKALDPQQRLLMEVSWQALENANTVPSSLHRSSTGVFVGLTPSSYANSYFSYEEEIRPYSITGNQPAFLAGRIAYTLGLQGPALAIDTACSSSLVAIHLACQSLRNGECQTALAGGVNLILSDESYRMLSSIKALSPTGRCHTFSSNADGYTRGEGCAMVVLKPLSAALKAGDRILALIKSSTVNHDGPSSGLTVPNGLAQQALISQALQKANVLPSQVSYLECHGTGTELGDPIEVQAASAIYGKGRSQDNPLIIGTVKTNIGHLEAASGIAGILKVVLALQHQKLPRNLHFTQPSSYIDWSNLPVEVNAQERDWVNNGQPRLAAVSAFGLSGTNAHIILEEAPLITEPKQQNQSIQSPYLLILSGDTEEALKAQAANYAKYIEEHSDVDLKNIAHSAALYRTHFAHRLSIEIIERKQLVKQLKDYAFYGYSGLAQVGLANLEETKIAYLFTGQGSQYSGMAKELYENEPTFRETLNKCLEIVNPHLDYSLLDIIFADEGSRESGLLNQTQYTQVALFAVEYSLYQMWKGFGVIPDVLLGHSIGEVVAATCAGVFSLEDGLRVALERGRLMGSVAQGSMLSLEVDEQKALELIKPYNSLSIAGVNSPNQTVISGQTDEIDSLIKTLDELSVKHKKLKVSHAFHSSMMNSILDEFDQVLRNVRFNLPSIAIASNLTGKIEQECFIEPSYWSKQIRQSVRFNDAIISLVDYGINTFIELGPQAILCGLASQSLETFGKKFNLISSLRANHSDNKSILQAIGKIWFSGFKLDWDKILPGDLVDLPTYPFQHQPYWLDSSRLAKEIKVDHLLHKIEWLPSEFPQFPSNRSNWLLFDDNSPLSNLLNETLLLLNQQVYRVKISSSFTFNQSNDFTINPESKDDYLLLLKTLKEKGDSVDKIIYLWTLENSLEIQIDTFFTKLALPLINLLGALASSSQQIEVSLVTCQAQSIHLTDQVSPTQSMLWAISRVVPWEHPNLLLRMIDVDISEFNSTEIAKQLLTGTLMAEREIAIRSGVVFKPRLIKWQPTISSKTLPLEADGTYLITGGTGGLGLALAKDFVSSGVRYLILLSRSGINTIEQQTAIAQLSEKGVTVWTPKVDVSDIEELSKLFAQMDKELPPLKGIVHAAGIGKERPLLELDNDSWLVDTASKINGATNLHKLTLDRKLDFFILYSSASAWLGLRQGGTYAAANAFLEGLAALRHNKGLPALSISWGAWRGAGMVQQRKVSQELATKLGIGSFSFEEGLKVLHLQGLSNQISIGVLPYDWEKYQQILTDSQKQLISSMLAEKDVKAFNQKDVLALKQSLKNLPESEQFSRLLSIIRSEIATVLALPESNSIPEEKPFQELGIDSLMAIETRNRLSAIFGIDLPTTTVLRFPTVHSLTLETLRLLNLGSIKTDVNINNKAIELVEEPAIQIGKDNSLIRANAQTSFLFRSQEAIASPSQQRLWFLDQVLEQKEAYNIHISFKINKIFDLGVFQTALELLIARHEQLRACFKEQSSIVKQRILPWVEPAFETYDLTNLSEQQQQNFLSEILNTQMREPFNLSQAPLFRVFLATLSLNQSAISITFHHIIIDGISVGVFLEELFLLYEAEISNKELDLAPAPSYLIYSKELNSWLDTAEANKQRIYWQNQLKELEPLSLPTDKPQPAKQNQQGDVVQFEFSLELSQKIDKLALEMELTPFVILSSGWSILLSRYSGQKDFTFGTFTSGRKQTGIEKAIGFFVNTLPIRCNLEANLTLSDYMLRLQETIWGALDNQDLPYNEIVQASAVNREFLSGGLFNTGFVLEEENWFKLPVENISLEFFANSVGMLEKTSLFHLTLSVIRSNSVYKANLVFLTSIFEKSTIERMTEHFLNILQQFVINPQQQLSDLDILTQEERNKLLLQWNGTKIEHQIDLCINSLFEQQVKTSPNALAVMLDEQYLTYSQLNAKANQLAHYLVSLGVKANELVGICLERSIDLLVAILGVIKAGAGYLPLDPHYPPDRLKFMIDDSKLNVLLSNSTIINELSLSTEKLFLFDVNIDGLDSYSTNNLNISIDLDSIAYVIYTSGSTGIPKGVVVSHKNLAYSTTVRCNYYEEKINKYLLLSSYSFDSSVAGIFWTLISGGALVLLREGEQKNIEIIRNVIREKEVSHLLCLPSLYELLITSGKKEDLKGLKVAIVAGETCFRELVNKHTEILNTVKLYNEYGPTEATVWSTVYEITKEKLIENSIVPIGRPIDGAQIYILDKSQNPTPIGVAGEIYIGGDGLTRGYLNRPELTAERFVPNQFSKQEGARLYKTGDLARWLSNGNIEFIGRIDNQVKLRGFRIELGEIENAIVQHQLVKECVVQINGEKTDSKQLVAYIVSAVNNKKQIVEELRTYLKTKLPDHMIPTAFVLLKELPITPNGKIDRKALLNINLRNITELEQSNLYVAPRTTIEKALSEIWKEILGVDRVGINDNFFELGGNSLKTIRVVSLASKKGLEINVHDIFARPTIAEMATLLDNKVPKTCLVPLRKGTKKGTLVYIPGAGGVLFTALALANTLNIDFNILGLTIPPLATGEPMPDSLKELCSGYAKELAEQEAPFILVGHSFGGTIALELAKELQDAKQEVLQVILLDSWLPELIPSLSRKEMLIELALQFNLDVSLLDIEDKIFNQLVEFLDFEKVGDLEPITLLNIIFDAIEKSISMLKDWKPKELNIPIHLVKASQKPKNIVSENIPLDLGWGKHIRLSSNEDVTGDHFSILRQPYVTETAQIIDKIL